MLIFSISMFTQTTINGDFIVSGTNNQIGQNCGNNLEQYTITGNLILDINNILDLKGVNLTVNGNIIGPGGYKSSCQNNLSILNDVIVPYDGVTLSTNTFEFNSSIIGLKYSVYNTSGQLVKSGIIDSKILESLPKNEILIVKVENYKPKKLLINK